MTNEQIIDLQRKFAQFIEDNKDRDLSECHIPHYPRYMKLSDRQEYELNSFIVHTLKGPLVNESN